jgi:hypothetical protein
MKLEEWQHTNGLANHFSLRGRKMYKQGREYKRVGHKPIYLGETLVTDHVEQVFEVKVNSLGGVHPDEIRRLLIAKYDAKVEEIKETVVVL